MYTHNWREGKRLEWHGLARPWCVWKVGLALQVRSPNLSCWSFCYDSGTDTEIRFDVSCKFTFDMDTGYRSFDQQFSHHVKWQPISFLSVRFARRVSIQQSRNSREEMNQSRFSFPFVVRPLQLFTCCRCGLWRLGRWLPWLPRRARVWQPRSAHWRCSADCHGRGGNCGHGKCGIAAAIPSS